MPSKSKSQQRFFGMVDAYKKGEMKDASNKIKKAAKGMSMDDVKDFAETKHKGLPEKVEENETMDKKLIRLTESDLHRIVKESVNRILKEYGNTPEGQRKLGALQARKVLNADGKTSDELFANQAKNGKKIYDYAKGQRSHMGVDSDEFGNTTNPLYKDYSKGYVEYLNAHPEEYAKRNDRLRKLGY